MCSKNLVCMKTVISDIMINALELKPVIAYQSSRRHSICFDDRDALVKVFVNLKKEEGKLNDHDYLSSSGSSCTKIIYFMTDVFA